MIALREILSEIRVIFRRELSLMREDKRLRSLLFLAPLINALIVCSVYAPSYISKVPIAVVQQDNSALTQRMTRWLDQHQKMQVVAKLPELAGAEALFLQGKIAGYIVFEKDFSQRLKRNEEARVLVFTDATNMVLANTINAAAQGVIQTFSTGTALQKARKLGAFKDQAQALVMPIRAETRPIGNPSFSYADFMLPGMLLSVLQQVILLALALSWAGEREAQTLPQLFSLSQRPWVILLAKNLPHIVIHLLWMLVFFGLVLPLSNVSSDAKVGTIAVFALLFVLVIVGWGTWVSLLVGDRLGATQALMFLAVPSFILSGYTWPSMALPEALQLFSQVLPLTHSAVMFRKLYGIGLDITAFPRELAALSAFILLHFLLAFWALHRVARARRAVAS